MPAGSAVTVGVTLQSPARSTTSDKMMRLATDPGIMIRPGLGSDVAAQSVAIPGKLPVVRYRPSLPKSSDLRDSSPPPACRGGAGRRRGQACTEYYGP
jgi:hypothetical protein